MEWKTARKYDVHAPRDSYYGCPDADVFLTLPEAVQKAAEFGATMVERFIPDGLNRFEEQNPQAVVIFDVETEDVVMIEEGSP